MKQISLRTLLGIFFLITFILFPVFAGGPDGYMTFSWTEIKQVKGGARECTIKIGNDAELYPDAQLVFDEKGRLIQYDMGYAIDKYYYMPDGMLKVIESGSPDENDEFTVYSKTVYTYDAKGKLTKISYQDGEGNEYMTEGEITYNKNGSIGIERTTPEGSVYKIDTYNKNFDLTESLTYTTESVAMGMAKKEIESKTTYKYDKDNNLTEIVTEYQTLPFEGVPKKITQTFKYEFDKKGNKTLQTTTLTPKNAADIFTELARPAIKFTYNYNTPKAKPTPQPPAPAGSLKIGQEVLVEYGGAWYPAKIMKQDGNKYFIHYTDYDSSWDEWVTKDRIK